MLEAAEAEDAKARADSQLAAARFAQHWGPLAGEPPEVRRKLVDAVVTARAVLVRADLPGRHTVGSLPAEALLDVDGMRVPGRVLGTLEALCENAAGLVCLSGCAERGALA